MKVILLERVERLGQIGDIVTVKDGHARNFLLPKNKAVRATKTNILEFESKRKHYEAENLKRKEDAEKVAKGIEGTVVTIIRQASEVGSLYGSVTARDIATALDEAKVAVKRQQIVIGNPIKIIGVHEVRVTLHADVSAGVVVNVAKSDDEAMQQITEHKDEDSKRAEAEKTEVAAKKEAAKAERESSNATMSEEKAGEASEDK